jgi:MFS family permease
MNDVTTGEHTDMLRELDESAITRTHWKIMFISGMGFFTDAYDLFVIGVVMTMLKEQWQVSPTADGLVTSTALLASAIGAVLFGRIADMLGRKRIYGFEVLVLAAGALASAASPDIWWLIVFRFILGIGIGGDYPVSSTIMSEYAGKKTRGLLITLVFAMQAAGLVFGPALAAVLLASGLSHAVTWRLLLAFGAVPAMAVFWMRRRMAETPRYLLASGQHEDFHATGRALLGRTTAADARQQRRVSFAEGFARLTARRDLVVRLIGASAA